ncbi:hypothetical protein GCM10010840_36650 [Deinococcus aerolatus]|uniref:Uncharacterized protein n=1 Tax=Deinococcus aerolatus TaxID=522487 RepID=A0ABQ2GHC6_9DEIO|nr:hypothetical protein [Deinococcus aerolatus]GGL95219.1 hypothetical protein GCM10010840_36650 [Deinococcus aerolatus]
MPTSTVTLRWVPGTQDRVRFEKGGRTFTVLLRDVQQADVHSVGPLYLRGSVILGVTRVHLSDLMGPLRQHVTARATGTPAGAWVDAGGLAADEPPSGGS